MVKVRVMGTKKEIIRFQRVLRKCPDIRMNEPSDIFTMKGTNNYFRNYMEVRFLEKKRVAN